MEIVVLIIGLVGLLLESLFLYKAIKNTGRARLLSNTAWSKLGQLEAGLVKIEGQVLAGDEVLGSPLMKRDCVYYRFQVKEKRQQGGTHGGGTHWKTIIDDARSVLCALDDGTGTVVLHLSAAEMELRPGDTENSGFLNDARPELERMLQKRYGESSVGMVFNRTLHYSEERVEDGDSLVVIGTARELPNGGWELVRGEGPFIVSDKGFDALLSSYRSASVGWWIAATLMPVGAIVLGAVIVSL